jgi:hypothetical protein
MRARAYILLVFVGLCLPTAAKACVAQRADFGHAYSVSLALQSLANEQAIQQRALRALPEAMAAIAAHEAALATLYKAERALFLAIKGLFARPDDAFVQLKDRLQSLDGGGRQGSTSCVRAEIQGQAGVSRDAVARIISLLTQNPESLDGSAIKGNPPTLDAQVFLTYLQADQRAEAAGLQRLQAEKRVLEFTTSSGNSYGLGLVQRGIGVESLRQQYPACFTKAQQNQRFTQLLTVLAETVPRPVPYDNRNIGYVAACELQAPSPSALLNLQRIEQQLASAALSRNNPDAYRYQQIKGRFATLYLHQEALQQHEKGLSQRLQLYQATPNTNPATLQTTRRMLQATQRHREQTINTLRQLEAMSQQYAATDSVQRWQRVRAQQQTLSRTLKASGFDSLKATLGLNPAQRLQLLANFSQRQSTPLPSTMQRYAANERTLAYLDGMEAFNASMLQRVQTIQRGLAANPDRFSDNSYDALMCGLKQYVSERLRTVPQQCLSPLQTQQLKQIEGLL